MIIIKGRDIVRLIREGMHFFGTLECQKWQRVLMCLLVIGIIPLTACGKNEIKAASAYQIPLEEIAERIEFEYIYENMIDHIADYDYKQLSFLPSGEDIDTSFYLVEGNKLLLLPEEKANTEVVLNNEICNLYYSQEAGGYVFYVLVDWQLLEQGVPVNSLEGDYYHRIRECIVRDKDAVYVFTLWNRRKRLNCSDMCTAMKERWNFIS